MIEGAYTALVTPFKNNQVDEQALRKLVDFQIEEGISGLVVCGTTGEGATLSDEEFEHVLRIVMTQADNKVPVISNAGTNATASSIKRAQLSETLGADALLLVCPYYNKPTQSGLEAHFQSIAKNSKLPLILYNVPSRSGVGLEIETLERLAKHPSFVAVKEASGNVTLTQQIFSNLGDRLQVFSGDDALTPAIMALGGSGVVSVASNILPKLISHITKLCLEKKIDQACALHYKLLPLHDTLFLETNPGPIKAALYLKSWIEPEIRLPMCWPSKETIERLQYTLKQAEVISCA